MTEQELIKAAADPHLIISAQQATELMSELNHLLSKLRLEFNEAELEEDLAYNKLYDELKAQGKSDEKIKIQRRITSLYQSVKKKERVLKDLRAIYRNLDKHKDLLCQQEMYRRPLENRAYLG